MVQPCSAQKPCSARISDWKLEAAATAWLIGFDPRNQGLRWRAPYGPRPRGVKARQPVRSVIPMNRAQRRAARGISLVRHVALEFVEPDAGVAVGRRTPVAARRQGAAGRHLGAVRHRRALELAEAEEALQEHTQPALDELEVVRAPAVVREAGRPRAALDVAPGMARQEGDLRRAEA